MPTTGCHFSCLPFLQDILTDLSAESESLHLEAEVQDCVAHKVQWG